MRLRCRLHAARTEIHLLRRISLSVHPCPLSSYDNQQYFWPCGAYSRNSSSKSGNWTRHCSSSSRLQQRRDSGALDAMNGRRRTGGGALLALAISHVVGQGSGTSPSIYLVLSAWVSVSMAHACSQSFVYFLISLTILCGLFLVCLLDWLFGVLVCVCEYVHHVPGYACNETTPTQHRRNGGVRWNREDGTLSASLFYLSQRCLFFGKPFSMCTLS